MNIVAIIPSRYASTRFPGKPLVNIAGKSMVQRVYEQTLKAIDKVYVATDDNRILDEVKRFGGKAIMTSTDHKSGTDRCAEAIKLIEEIENKSFDVIVNIQGDEPFIQPGQITKLCDCFADHETRIATLAKPFGPSDDISDSNKVKVVLSNNHFALYFSRAVIPFIRNNDKKETWASIHKYFLHIGLYAYKKDTLFKITKLLPSSLENAESLEQLRWLENDFNIKVEITDHESFGIDTPEDLKKLSDRIPG